MNRKMILGITVLALVVMGLTFTACLPQDNEERFVIFENNTNITIDLTFKGIAPVTLERGTQTKGFSQKVSNTGDIVLQTITFGDNTVDTNPEQYIILKGALVGGKTKKGMVGIPLEGGKLEFWPNTNEKSAACFKISVIPQDE